MPSNATNDPTPEDAMRFGGIPLEWLERQAAGPVRAGATFERLLTDSLIDVRVGDNEGVVSPAQHLLFCLNSVIAAGDAAHALSRRAMSRLYPDIGVRLFVGCPTLESAIRTASRLYISANSTVHIDLQTEEDEAVVSIYIEADDRAEGTLLEEIFLVWIFQQILRYLGRPPPKGAVTLRDPFHFNLGRRHWGIGAPVSLGTITGFHFPKRVLAEGSSARGGDNVLWETHENWVEHLRGTPVLPGLDSYVSGGEFIRFSDVARRSGVSPNTLRRQFQSTHGNFRETRQRTLVEAAVGLLRSSNATVEAIAAELGYSDDRSLRRFLKTATGFTPQQLRERVQLEDAQANPKILERIRTLGERMSS